MTSSKSQKPVSDTDRALVSAKMFLHEGFPLRLIHQPSQRVVEEGGVSHDLVLLRGHRHRQVGFLPEPRRTGNTNALDFQRPTFCFK